MRTRYAPLAALVVLLFAGLALSLPLLATAQPATIPHFAQLWGEEWGGGGITLTITGPTMHLADDARRHTARRHVPIAAGISGTLPADPAVTALPDGTLITLWGRTRCLDDCALGVTDLRYRLVTPDGTPQETIRLTDHSTATVNTYDREPVMAVAPNGTVGVLWRRFQFTDTATTHSPLDVDRAGAAATMTVDNLYVTTLTANGKPKTSPTSLTDYALSDEAPTHDMARIASLAPPGKAGPSSAGGAGQRGAAADDDRFVIAWEERIGDTSTLYNGIQPITGTAIVSPTAFYSETAPGVGFNGVDLLARGDTVLIGLLSGIDGMLEIAALDSSGTVVTPMQAIPEIVGSGDLVLTELSTGQILAVWTAYNDATYRYQVQYAVLDDTLALVTGPTFIEQYDDESAERLSVVPQQDGAVLTWMASSGEQLFYAAVDSAGTQTVPTTLFETMDTQLAVSTNGYGATTWQVPMSKTHSVYVPLITR